MGVTCASFRLSGNLPLFSIVFAMSLIGIAIIIFWGIWSTPVDFFEFSVFIHFLLSESLIGVKSKFSFNPK